MAVLGVLLCGGQSRRMGTDKGLIETEEGTWAERLVRLFDELELPWVVSINPQQVESYQKIFSPEKLIADSIDLPGPLRGLLSVHAKWPEEDLLALACDMQQMKYDVMADLVEKLKPELDGVVYEGEKLEPLCAAYTAGFLSRAASNAQLSPAPKDAIETGNFVKIPITPALLESFQNINTWTENGV